MIYPRLGPTFLEKKDLNLGMWYTAFQLMLSGNSIQRGDVVNLLINLPNSHLAHPYRNKITETNVYGILSNLLALTTLKLCIRQAMPIPLGNSGAFSHTFHPRGQALAFHPITPGHLTISLYSLYSIVAIGKYSNFPIEYV